MKLVAAEDFETSGCGPGELAISGSHSCMGAISLTLEFSAVPDHDRKRACCIALPFEDLEGLLIGNLVLFCACTDLQISLA